MSVVRTRRGGMAGSHGMNVVAKLNENAFTSYSNADVFQIHIMDE